MATPTGTTGTSSSSSSGGGLGDVVNGLLGAVTGGAGSLISDLGSFLGL
jgi:hypothetical protein